MLVYTNLDLELYSYPTSNKLNPPESKSTRIVPAITLVRPHLG